MEAEQVILDQVQDAAGGIIGSAGGRFFGWVIGGTLPAALAADWLSSTWDQNAAAYACGPAVAVMEEVAGQWLKDMLGLPEQAGFAMTTGSQMAHVTGLAAARHALLRNRGWDVERKGLNGAPPIRIISSQERHGSVARAVHMLGFGTDCILDRHTDAAIEAILNTGEAFFSRTTWRGRRCMRVSVCNWQTTEHDVDRTVEAVRAVLEA